MTPASGGRRFLLKSAEIESLEEIEAHHPLNPRSGVHIRSLSGELGLGRVGFHLCRLPAGREANEYHTHEYEEEFYYVVSGRGVALVDGQEHEVGPGDFLAFPAPSVPHLLRNPFDADLVYLAGGERREFEIAEFPRHGKMLFRDRGRAYMVDRGDLEEARWKKTDHEES